ncbi:MAG: phosphopantothenoylcysteine decarboxylase, partial [Chloroflexota bacterium]|nr:phosphopantothenoylcysteine decarboxylase [Chloroflexota bacterium]
MTAPEPLEPGASPDPGAGPAEPGPGPLDGRLVLLGVTGSIAAYKAAELVRLLGAAGADVQVLMTHTAAQFIGPLTMETLSRRPVMLDPLELLPDRRIAHIVAADTADVILVAPATARWLGAMANGLADDVVTATCLASSAPVVVAPAMDGEMYAHPATRANVERLRSFGYEIVEPEVGSLA